MRRKRPNVPVPTENVLHLTEGHMPTLEDLNRPEPVKPLQVRIKRLCRPFRLDRTRVEIKFRNRYDLSLRQREAVRAGTCLSALERQRWLMNYVWDRERWRYIDRLVAIGENNDPGATVQDALREADRFAEHQLREMCAQARKLDWFNEHMKFQKASRALVLALQLRQARLREAIKPA
jgi:hypothetical protein